MSIIINDKKCIGCMQCLSICPGNLIKRDDKGKAFMKYPKDCWGCASCIKECRNSAIALYLGADIGGRGSRLTVNIEGDIIHWQVEKSNGRILITDVDRKNANQY